MFPPNEIYLAALMRAQSAAQLLPHLVRAASVPEAKIQVDKTHSFTDIGCRLQGCLPDLRQSPGHQCAWHVTVSICHYSGTSHTLLFRIYAHEHASAQAHQYATVAVRKLAYRCVATGQGKPAERRQAGCTFAHCHGGRLLVVRRPTQMLTASFKKVPTQSFF